MKRALALILVTLFTLCLAGAATAQAKKDEDGRPIIYPDKTEVDFPDLGVEGDKKGPDGVIWVCPPAPKVEPLVKLRRDFNPEMQQSVLEL